MNQDDQHLQLLSIFHFVLALIIAAFSCFPVFHLAMGIILMVAPQSVEASEDVSQMDRQMMTLMGLLFTVIPAVIIVSGWLFAGFIALAGRFIARRAHYHFCLVMAGVACIFMPFGTILGVFAIIVLVRPSVKEAFGCGAAVSAKPGM